MAYEFKIPKTLKSFNLFIKGKGLAGRVGEVILPKLALKADEYSAGGMDIPIDLDMGMQKMESTMVLNEYNPEVIKLFGLGKRNPVEAVLKGALHDEDEVTKVEVELRGMFTEVDMGAWKPNEKQSLSLSMSVRYYKLTIGDAELVEVDAINMVRKINGEDQLQDIRNMIS